MGNKWRRSISRVWSVVWGDSSLFRWFVPLAVRCREHPCLWNFNSAVSIDVIRVYVNCLFDLTCVVMKITINKLNFVPVDWLMSGVVVLLWNGEGIRDISNCRLKFLVVRALSGLLTLSCVLFLAFAYFTMYRGNTASPREDKNKTNAQGRSRKIYQREQGTWDNCLCSWGCYRTLCDSISY